MAIFALGPLRIELDGKPLQTSRHKALALLVYLAMLRGKDSPLDEEARQGQQSREALSALFWSDYDQGKAFAYLRRTLWEMNEMLGEGWLEADRAEIGYAPSVNIFLDVSEFQSHLTAVRQHTHPESHFCQECITHLHTAAMLYRGDFLTGFGLRDSPGFEDWQFFQREAIRREYASGLQELSTLLHRSRSYSEAVLFSQRWLALDNLNEEAHRLLMKIFAETGQRHLALRQYKRCEQILQTDLGVQPEPATNALYEAIVSGTFQPGDEFPSKPPFLFLQETPDKGFDTGTAPAQKMSQSSSLPTFTTPFIGRRDALEQLSSLLSQPDCWLLTLLGPGGIGKTRLAVEIGREQIPHFPQGVFFVALSMIERESAIAPTIARSVGLTFRQNGPTPEEQLHDFLREKRMLLILDSFEQLVQWPRLLEEIHMHAQDIKILVTSRHRLMLQAEYVMELKGLNYPPKSFPVVEMIQAETIEAYSAIELFLHLARRTRVLFQASAEDLGAIIQITQLMEGIPLGLELASTWVNVLSCQEIAAELSHGLDILETSLGDISQRQRSMRAVFDHSWKLLSSREQTLLPRLAVFRGSFTRQAAEQAAGISLRELSGLVDKSLVRRTTTGRFYLHDLLRQYCVEILSRHLSDEQETRGRHCTFYTGNVSAWNKHLFSAKQGEALQQIEADLENIQAAWDWALVNRQFELMEQVVDGLGVFYLRKARMSEGYDIFEQAGKVIKVTSSSEEDIGMVRLAVRMITWQAALCMNLERFEEASRLLEEGDRILTHPELGQQVGVPERVFWLNIHGLVANLQFDPAAGYHDYQKAVQLAQGANMKSPSMFLFFWRFMMGGSPSREMYIELGKNLEYVRQSDDSFELACYLYTLGIAELYHEYRVEKAVPMLMESIHHFQQVGDLSALFMIFKTKGYLLLTQGQFDAFYTLKQRELAFVEDIGDCRLIGIAHAEIGEVLNHLGKYQEAEEQIRKGMVMIKDRSAAAYALRHRYLGDALLAQGKNAEAKEAYLFSYRYFQRFDEKGWMMTALTGLSRAAFALGDCPGAWQYAKQALQLYHELQLYTFFVYLTLAEFALLLVDRGEVIQGLEVYQLAVQQGYLAHSCWFADLFGKLIDNVTARLSAEEQESLKQSGAVPDLQGIIQKLSEIFSG